MNCVVTNRCLCLSLAGLTPLLSTCTTPPTNVRTQLEICFEPLSAYCSGERCPTYARWRAEAERDFKTGAHVCNSEGICGDLHFVERGGLGGEIAFFNTDGELVAARHESDSLSGPCGGRTYYGPQPTCAPQVTNDMCRWRRR